MLFHTRISNAAYRGCRVHYVCVCLVYVRDMRPVCCAYKLVGLTFTRAIREQQDARTSWHVNQAIKTTRCARIQRTRETLLCYVALRCVCVCVYVVFCRTHHARIWHLAICSIVNI